MFELNFSNLSNLLKNKIDSKKFLKLLYQSSVRDFSFTLKKLSCGDIVDLYSVDVQLIKRVKIFDNYIKDLLEGQ